MTACRGCWGDNALNPTWVLLRLTRVVFIQPILEYYRVNTALFHVVTLCSADEDACYATSDGGGAACPYTQCRAAILKYLSVRIT
jgi:hypothetical protein